MSAKLDEALTSWLGASYRTTIAGYMTVLVSVLLLFGNELGITTEMSLKITQALGLLTGGGLMVARDNRVSSERAGAR